MMQARGAMLMFVAAFLTFMAIGGFPAFVEDMRVYQDYFTFILPNIIYTCTK
jgi:hypothetical protein